METSYDTAEARSCACRRPAARATPRITLRMPYRLTCVSRSAPLGLLRSTANFHVKLVQASGAFGWRSTATATGPNRALTIFMHSALLVLLVEAGHHVCHVDVAGDKVSHVCRKRSHTAEVARHRCTMLWSGLNVALLLHRSLRWPEDWSATRRLPPAASEKVPLRGDIRRAPGAHVMFAPRWRAQLRNIYSNSLAQLSGFRPEGRQNYRSCTCFPPKSRRLSLTEANGLAGTVTRLPIHKSLHRKRKPPPSPTTPRSRPGRCSTERGHHRHVIRARLLSRVRGTLQHARLRRLAHVGSAQGCPRVHDGVPPADRVDRLCEVLPRTD